MTLDNFIKLLMEARRNGTPGDSRVKTWDPDVEKPMPVTGFTHGGQDKVIELYTDFDDVLDYVMDRKDYVDTSSACADCAITGAIHFCSLNPKVYYCKCCFEKTDCGQLKHEEGCNQYLIAIA